MGRDGHQTQERSSLDSCLSLCRPLTQIRLDRRALVKREVVRRFQAFSDLFLRIRIHSDTFGKKNRPKKIEKKD